ncbi:MAG: Cof-type HAD-IIB family hydrolase [Anaerolineae bacterium]
MMIQLIAFDLDGTLMDGDQRISPRVRKALSSTVGRGVKVTLATGRMFSATVGYARDLGIEMPLICYQGGWIQGLNTDVLRRVTLPQDHAHAALALGQTEGWHRILYADGQLYIDEPRYPLRFYEQLLGPNPEIRPDLEQVLEHHEADKVLFVADPDRIPDMGQLLNNRFGQEAEVVRSHAQFVEVVPKGVDKGSALAWLAEYVGVPREATLAVGDQENDLSMIRWAGTGVAMGNATTGVKQAAAWTAPSVGEDGAAAILEQLILAEDSS